MGATPFCWLEYQRHRRSCALSNAASSILSHSSYSPTRGVIHFEGEVRLARLRSTGSRNAVLAHVCETAFAARVIGRRFGGATSAKVFMSSSCPLLVRGFNRSRASVLLSGIRDWCCVSRRRKNPSRTECGSKYEFDEYRNTKTPKAVPCMSKCFATSRSTCMCSWQYDKISR